MSFIIINSVPNETINLLNARYNLNLSKSIIRDSIIPALTEQNSRFYRMKRFMETNKQVVYECNKD